MTTQRDKPSEDSYQVSRPVFSEKALTEECVSPTSSVDSKKLNLRKCMKTCSDFFIANCCCHGRKMDWLRKRLPITDWLPKYSPKQDGIPDLIGGLTVGIMHIPQGLAFGMLASLPPVTGLYTSLIPVIVYMLMGTSRYLSMGAFPVVCMMIAEVVNRGNVPSMSGNDTGSYMNSTIAPTPHGSVSSPEDARKLEIAVSLAFLIGVIHTIMGFLRLGVLTRYLSDPVISGFTTGAAVVIITSQIKPILGLNIPRYAGLFALVKSVIAMLTSIASSNLGSIIIGILCILLLMALKYLNDRYSQKLPFPIPAELLVVILATGISYGAQLNSRFGVQIVKNIPKGMPPISTPSFKLMGSLISDAIKISIVVFATNISVAKLFAKRKKQTVDSDQELIAYGLCNVGVSFFSGFPSSIAIARVVVQANLARTQMCSIPVIAILVLVLLFIAPLFFYLPKAVLSAIVIANLLGLLKQFARIKQLWMLCRADSVVWCMTCFGVIFLGIDIGLGCGVFAAFLSVILLSSKPKYSILGNIPNTDIYRDVRENPKAREFFDVKIVRFESFLYYANVEYFREVLNSIIVSREPSISYDSIPSDTVVNMTNGDGQEKRITGKNDEGKPFAVQIAVTPVHTVIVDASTFTYVDSMGIEALRSIGNEFKGSGIRLYLANCSGYLQDQLEKSSLMEDYQIERFVSIHDAVLYSKMTPSRPNGDGLETTTRL